MTNKRRGLNLGLSHLLDSEDEPPQQPAPSGLRELPIDSIQPNANQPRKHFDEKALQELASSIEEHGLLQPIVVSAAGEPGRYQIIAGERRWRAAQLAGRTSIPAVIKETSADQSLVLALVENIQRADLDPLEEARAYEALQLDYNLTQEEISKQVGKSRSTITNTLRLLNLPPSAKQAISEGNLTQGQLRPFLTFDNATIELVVEQLVANPMPVRKAEAMAKLMQEQRLTPAEARRNLQQRDVKPRHSRAQELDELAAPISIDDQYVQDKLQRFLATAVRLERHTKGGRVIIDFANDEILQSIFEQILGPHLD